MTIVFSSYVKEVIKVPKEIQFVIIKWVIHDYLENISFDWDKHIHRPLYPRPVYFTIPLRFLTVLMDIDPLLDNILADVIKEMTFDGSIFESNQLKKFADFVLAKSIKIHLQVPFSIKLDKVVMILLNLGCCEYTSTVSNKYLKDLYYNHLQFITSLECGVALLGHLFEVTEELKLLVRLKCLKISGIFNTDMDFLVQELVQKLIAWRRHCACDSACHCKGECECVGHIKKRVVLSFDLDYSNNNSASMLVSRSIDLNRNGYFEIEYHGIIASRPLGLHLLSDSHDDDITLFQLFDLKNPLDNYGLKVLTHISKHTDQIMSAIEHNTTDYLKRSHFAATKYSSNFTSMDIKYIKSGFSFKNVKSLKKVKLMNCTIDYECLNSLPDTLLALTLNGILIEASEVHEIKFPTHLNILAVSISLDICEVLSDIVNRDQLGELNTADIYLSPMDTYCDDTEIKESLFLQLKKFLHELPVLKYFRLMSRGMDMKQMIGSLSLNTFDSLVALSLTPEDSGFYNVFPISCLPPACHALELGRFTTLDRQFPETLIDLRISLNEYTKSFEYFWDRFITPLNNLHFLEIGIPNTTYTIDFSYLQFPDKLHTLILKVAVGTRLFFNELPPSMIWLTLRYRLSKREAAF
ncbi:unnamed protein product [Ambrosiozyma monospora]|uniref:Unnamed protein product n=1 Tax=Ambrosiozyma monospora TaxID=43982 RepID=A0ACB5SZU7_AMBMO|nr:unnamed protein product [Ambrosiozyma monospora]